MAEKKLPIGIQDFPKLIQGNHLYVDKTEYYHRLITQGNYYFLSRPRRFGKSLLISTLQAIFEGERELFQGLWIHDKIDWKPRPVIKLDFSEIASRETPLAVSLDTVMDELFAKHGLAPLQGDYSYKFRNLIRHLGADQKVAILVDEYDKPILNFIDEPEQARENRAVMKNLYSVVKGNDAYIAFFILTGVTKFSQVSIFSDLNHLQDISIGPAYCQMLGYTQEEIERCFPEHLERLRLAHSGTYPDVMAEMKAWYNGYSWDGEHDVYNPFSILNLFSTNEFGEYWFATGTPTFLMRLIKTGSYSIFDLEDTEISLHAFNKFDIDRIEIKSLLFQTGYLTIKSRNKLDLSVTLDFPNREVRNAFSIHLLSEFAEKSQEGTDSLLRKMSKCLKSGQVEGFMASVDVLFRDIAYPIQPPKGASISNLERYYHSMFFLMLRLLGYNIQVEVFTHNGRIDAVITTGDYVYIVEFKLGDAATAIAQIKDKGYHRKYAGGDKKVILIGIGFDVAERIIGGYLVEETA